MKLSVIIPVYNERNTIREIVSRVLDTPFDKEIIVVDDGSTDGTSELLKDFPAGVKVLTHRRNLGKGAAVRTGLEHAAGGIIIIQDADLEYDPRDYPALVAPVEAGLADAVYGSRNLSGRNPSSSAVFYLGGVFLSKLSNILYGTRLTDEATGYKVFRAEVLKSLDLRCTGFEFCPEVTGKLARGGYRIKEVPISYAPRSRNEGKKIGVKDGVSAVYNLFRHRFFG